MTKSTDNPKRQPRPIRIAYLGPAALFDPSSGAAQSLTTLLNALSRMGAHCFALTGSCFDRPMGREIEPHFAAKGLAVKGKTNLVGLPVWAGKSQGFSHTVMHVRSQQRMAMNATEEMEFSTMAEAWLKKIKPDVILTFGGLLLDIELRRLAQASGAMVAFYLANPKYAKPRTFHNVNIVLTNSSGTKALYEDRMRLRSYNIGLFVDPQTTRVENHKPEFVTFINPQAEKGVTLFLQLVARARRECPSMRFLVVESRAKVTDALKKLKLPQSLMESITVLPTQTDMRVVYEQTKILLMPSFWFEAAGRILIEASSNGIPVIATDRGGIPETLAGAGILLDVPQACTKDHWHVPTEVEIDPWWQALQHLWQDQAHYEVMQAKASAAAAQAHSLQKKTQNVLGLLLKARKVHLEQQQVRATQAAATVPPKTTVDASTPPRPL